MSREIETSNPDLGGITLTQFWGGEDRGTCVQINQPVQGPAMFQHLQLTKEQALALAADLHNWCFSFDW